MMTTITHLGLREFLKEGTLIRILRLFCTKKATLGGVAFSFLFHHQFLSVADIDAGLCRTL